MNQSRYWKVRATAPTWKVLHFELLRLTPEMRIVGFGVGCGRARLYLGRDPRPIYG